MKKSINLSQIASNIADMIKQGIDIHVYLKKDVIDTWNIIVTDPATSSSVHLIFNVTETKPVHQDKDEASRAPIARPATHKKRDSRWWSRFNFEKNIMKMTLFALQDRYPYEDGYRQDMFAAKLAAMMSWKESTAKRHITEAAKMGIINRAVFGTTYYIMGVNNEDAQTLQEEMADRQQEPEMMPLPDTPLAHEGRIQFEQEFDKAVDETVLP